MKLLLLACTYVSAYQLGTKRPGDLVGVCPGAVVAGKGEPFIGTFMTKIQQSGAKWFRYPFGMDGISQCSGGCYNWDGWTPWVTSALSHGLTVLGTIGWPPSWACVNGLPNIAAMSDYAAQTVNHYKSQIHYWEIFNEVNFKFNYCGADNPAHYAQLLQACYAAIKQADPTAFVLPSGLAYPGAGDGTDPITFINTLYSSGSKNSMDALNIHPYTYTLAPMSSESWNPFSHLQNIRDIMVKNGDSGKKLWITEMGHSVCSDTSECVNPDTQAQYLVWALGNATVTYDFIGPLIWYEWYDQGSDYSSRESVYGIYDVNGNPRPAAAAFAASIGPPSGSPPVVAPPTPAAPTPAAGTTLKDLGAGCCASLGAPVFNAANPNCASDCLANSACVTAVYGWNDGCHWCQTYNSACTSLASGPTDCGSSGNNGVHTYVKTTATTSPPTVTPPSNIPPNLMDRGAGCDPSSPGDIQNAANPNCLADCLANSNCKCVIYGWANSQWCRSSSVACTGALTSGPTDCGSSGNTGVHTYVRAVSAVSSVAMKDQGAGCPASLSVDLFNAANPNCLADCVSDPKCQTATYGWASSQWCCHFSGAYSPPLLAGPKDCGSSGNNGVHTFSKTTSVQTMQGQTIPVVMLPVAANATFASDSDPVWIPGKAPTPGSSNDVSSAEHLFPALMLVGVALNW